MITQMPNDVAANKAGSTEHGDGAIVGYHDGSKSASSIGRATLVRVPCTSVAAARLARPVFYSAALHVGGDDHHVGSTCERT